MSSTVTTKITTNDPTKSSFEIYYSAAKIFSGFRMPSERTSGNPGPLNVVGCPLVRISYREGSRMMLPRRTTTRGSRLAAGASSAPQRRGSAYPFQARCRPDARSPAPKKWINLLYPSFRYLVETRRGGEAQSGRTRRNSCRWTAVPARGIRCT